MQLLDLMYDISDNPSYVMLPRANTRQADNISFATEIVRYDIYQKSPYYVGSNLWSKLSAEIQKKERRNDFKVAIRNLYGNCINL